MTGPRGRKIPKMVSKRRIWSLCAVVLSFQSYVAGAAFADEIETRRFTDGLLQVLSSEWTNTDYNSAYSFLEASNNITLGSRQILGIDHKVTRMKDRDGAYSLRSLGRLGGERHYSLLMVCHVAGAVRLIEYQGPHKLFVRDAKTPFQFMKSNMEGLCEEQVSSQNRPIASHKAEAADGHQLESVLDSVDRLWHIGQMVPRIGGYIAEQKSVLSFSDGWATTRIDNVLTKGVSSSQRSHPGSWGRWKLNAKDELSVRWGSDETYRDFYFAFSVPRATTSTDFNGCFSKNRAEGLSGIGETNVAVSVNTWCFASDGRFTNDRTIGFSYGDGRVGTNGSNSSASSGTYTNDGYLLSLRYDNGRLVQTLAGISNDVPGKRDLLLGGSHFNEIIK